MLVRYRGKQSGIKSLPGGGPQYTLLGLLLFIILINDVGFEGQVNNLGDIITSRKNMKRVSLIHLKYVDDLSLAESINLPEKLVLAPGRQQPDTFHARTGHVLPKERSHVVQQLRKTSQIYIRVKTIKVFLLKVQILSFWLLRTTWKVSKSYFFSFWVI